MARRLTLLLAGAALVAAAAPAYAATGSPPVTSPDTVVVRAGEGGPLDVTANDKDPDGDQLEVCRVGPTPHKVVAEVEDGHLDVFPSPRARGTYTITYYACDENYLTPGTLTVRVRPPAPSFEIVPVGDAPPGRIRLVNTYRGQTFHCVWHPLGSEKVEGRATVRPRSTVVITVHEGEVQIDCESPRSGVSASSTS